jgi:hypothetical protein
MDRASITPVNHHADFPGFAGVTGLLAGLIMLAGRGGVARLAADLTSVSRRDRVVDVGCGPGTAAREAARRGARVIGVDPAPVMLRLARALTRDRAAIDWVGAPPNGCRDPTRPRQWCGRWPPSIIGRTSLPGSPRPDEYSSQEGDSSRSNARCVQPRLD